MKCYRSVGCGPYENRSCSECPASKPEYVSRNQKNQSAESIDHSKDSFDGYKDFLSLRRYLFDFWNKHGMDECHKSYEWTFELLLSFPNYFDNGADNDEPDYFEITLHCYVLGPHRHYHWRGNNFKEVVKEARHDIERWINE